MSRRVALYLNEETGEVLRRTSNEIDEILKLTREIEFPISAAERIIFGGFHFNGKYGYLLDDARILAEFVLGTTAGLTIENFPHKTDGLLLNLNRPFENLLTKALTATGLFQRESSKLNDIYFVGQAGKQASRFRMRPDCRGYLQLLGQRSHVIFDAKHKIISSDVEEDDCVHSRINRNDFYQMISYARTQVPTEGPGVYAIVGLNEETSESVGDWQRLPSICVEFGGEKFILHRVAGNFGRILSKVGNSLSRRAEFESMLVGIGKSLITEIEKASRESTQALSAPLPRLASSGQP